MRYFVFLFLYEFFEIQCILYIYSTSQFGRVTFQSSTATCAGGYYFGQWQSAKPITSEKAICFSYGIYGFVEKILVPELVGLIVLS